VSRQASGMIVGSWKQHFNKEGGRRRFQLDLCVLLVKFGIRYDRRDVCNEKHWMRLESGGALALRVPHLLPLQRGNDR